MKNILFYLFLVQIALGNTPNFGDKQISIMLSDYFSASKDSPTLLGHQFYQNRDRKIFQIEIQIKTENVNNAMIFSFKAMSRLANLAKTNFDLAILVMHFEENINPVIAESEILCSKDFFITKIGNENQWRKNCLTIRDH